jgi:predicted DNA-binding protein
MLLNSVYSYLFNVEVSDRFVLAMRSKKSLTYGELRKIILVRHTNFSINIYKSIDIKLLNENNRIKIDYSIMEVLEIFRVYINQPILIDNLILTHQYTCDVWKNGSKLLYFYTLHNQEHAVGLIKNIIKLVKAIDYIKISSQDYYMLFIASYLHDISMVKIPHSDCFLLDNFSADNIASEMIEKIDKLIEDNKYKDVTNIKKLIVNTYKKVEDFYSNYVRDKHANDSANEIRTRDELNYLDKCLRELVADIAIAHCYDVHDIYHIKSEASTRLVSVKFDKILLRLADLLDMDDFRISRSILNHNLEHMSLESAFHWISHLLTKGYKIETFYEVNDKSSLKPKSVIEKLVITIFVDISQLSEIINNSKCKCVKILSNKITAEGIEILCGDVCNNDKCNFLCKWFTRKNSYLIEELSALNQYLRRVPDNYFDSDVVIKVQVSDKTKLDAKLFEIIKEYITDNSEI